MLTEVMQWNYGWVVVMTWRLKCVMAQDFGRLQLVYGFFSEGCEGHGLV